MLSRPSSSALIDDRRMNFLIRFEKTATQKIRRFKYKESAPTVEEEMKNK